VGVEKGRITVTLAARSAAILTDRRLAVGGG
jgi:hypothetical protein